MEDFLSDGPFLVVYSDNVFDFDLGGLLTAHAESAAVATLALFDPDTHAHTDVAGGRVEMDRSVGSCASSRAISTRGCAWSTPAAT